MLRPSRSCLWAAVSRLFRGPARPDETDAIGGADNDDNHDRGGDGDCVTCSVAGSTVADRQCLIWLEPVSVPKGVAAIEALGGLLCEIDFISPNEVELVAMARAMERAANVDRSCVQDPETSVGACAEANSRAASEVVEPDDATLRRAAAILVRCGVRNVVTTRGAKGVLWARAAGSAIADAGEAASEVGKTETNVSCELGCEFELFEAPFVDNLVDTRGAGDCFVAGACWALLNRDAATCDTAAVRAALRAGLQAARLTVLSEEAVSRELCHERLTAEIQEAGRE